MTRYIILAAAAVVACALLAMPVGGDLSGDRGVMRKHERAATDEVSSAPGVPIDIVFLHHSVGARLLASPGPETSASSGFPQHPDGGGLAALLASNNYRLHEATFGSALGEHTDLFDWLPKFHSRMEDILAVQHQDERLPDGQRNRVVLFKSCFPNNEFVGAGSGNGSPSGPELTEDNARATMIALRAELAARPDVLFVYMTAPPVAPHTWSERRWKWLLKKALGRPTHDEEFRQSGAIARRFNEWVASPDGWLNGYAGRNIVVFDLYGELTDQGLSNFSRYPSGDGTDSHPSREGNARVAARLVPFLNREVRKAGLAP